MSKTLEFALLYARRGWHVFPLWGVSDDRKCLCPKGLACDRPGKHPQADLVPRGDHDATIHEPTIRSWWAEDPEAGVGVALAPSGLVVLDVDVSGGKPGRESLAALASSLPETADVVTGSGGLHLWFQRTNDSQLHRLIQFEPGLDLLGRGYAVAPPTLHASGNRYRWTGIRPLAPLPLTLASRFGRRGSTELDAPAKSYPPASPELLEHARQRLRRHGPAISGAGGDAHTYQVGAILLRGYALAPLEAWELAKEWNSTCSPPWEESELADKLRNGARYGQGGIGEERDVVEVSAGFAEWLANAIPKPVPGTWAADVAQALADVRAYLDSANVVGGPAPLFESARSLIARSFPPTVWLIDRLLTDGGIGALAAEPKSAKSWAAIELALALATGTPAFGEFGVPAAVDVAYFFAEDHGQSVRNRLRACGGAGREDLSRLHVQPRGRDLDLTRDEDVALVVASVRRLGGVRLLVLDPLRDVHSGEEDSSDSMADVMRRLRAIAALLSCTVLFVHHAAKSSADSAKRRQGQRMRGSSAIHGAIDSGIYLSDLQGNGENEFSNTVISEVKAAKGAGMFSLVLRIQDGADGTAVKATWTVSRTSPEKKASEADAEADAVFLEVLRKAGPRTWSELRAMIQGTNVAKDASKARLLLAGVIEEVTETVYDSLHRAQRRKVVRMTASVSAS